mgnify:CR=1 FL=1
MMLITLEPRVMGTPMSSSFLRIGPARWACSPLLLLRRWRSSQVIRKSAAAAEPTVTPKMAAAAPISTLTESVFSTYQASPRPMKSLKVASSTWEAAVGTMLPRPWV